MSLRKEAAMFNLFKKPVYCDILSPVDGVSLPLEEVPDPVFAQKMMGEGIAFRFEGEKILSPLTGTVLLVAATRHAVGLKGANGVEVLLHVGMEHGGASGPRLGGLRSAWRKSSSGRAAASEIEYRGG